MPSLSTGTEFMPVWMRRPAFPSRSVETKRSGAGFTLLEMTLVLFLIGLMASAALMLTEGVEDQAKYEETKRRMEMIRKAIVGDPTRTVNGSPEISGFVADMGRLPGCLRELMEAFDCADTANPLTQWTIEPTTGVASGWRGPYIQVLPERDGTLRFRDGYGNSDASDEQNSGWAWRLYKEDETLTYDVDEAVTIRVQSFGMDGTQSYPIGDVDDEAPENRPVPLIVKDDWKIQLPATVNVTFKNQSAGDLPVADRNLMLRIYLSDLTNSIEGDDGESSYLTLAADSPVLAGNRKTVGFTLDASPDIPIGTRAYAVVCHEVPATGNPDEYVVFDGDCDPENADQNTGTVRTFAVLPRQILTLNLDWIIP